MLNQIAAINGIPPLPSASFDYIVVAGGGGGGNQIGGGGGAGGH